MAAAAYSLNGLGLNRLEMMKKLGSRLFSILFHRQEVGGSGRVELPLLHVADFFLLCLLHFWWI